MLKRCTALFNHFKQLERLSKECSERELLLYIEKKKHDLMMLDLNFIFNYQNLKIMSFDKYQSQFQYSTLLLPTINHGIKIK